MSNGSCDAANSAGSKAASNSKSAVPVISTWSSRSRHFDRQSAAGKAISTNRLRASGGRRAAVAQAAEPQAWSARRRAPSADRDVVAIDDMGERDIGGDPEDRMVLQHRSEAVRS